MVVLIFVSRLQTSSQFSFYTLDHQSNNHSGAEKSTEKHFSEKTHLEPKDNQGNTRGKQE